MSRIGKKPVSVPSGVKVDLAGAKLKVTGPKGTLQLDCHPEIKMQFDSGANLITIDNPKPNSRQHKALHGTMRSLVNNMVTGVSKGFEKQMQIFGTGYNLKEQGDKLCFQVGYCHSVDLPVPKGVKVKIDVAATRGNDVPAKFLISGADKCVVGQFAAEIRAIRPPEPYKGKGIRYADEHVRRKVGKAFASGS